MFGWISSLRLLSSITSGVVVRFSIFTSLKMKLPIKLTLQLKVRIENELEMCQVHFVQCASARKRYNPPRPRPVLCIVFPITGTSASRLSYLESHDWVPKVLQNSQIKSTNNLAQCLSPPLARTPLGLPYNLNIFFPLLPPIP